MLHRWPRLRAYCAPEFAKLFAWILGAREQIKADIDEAALWQNVKADVDGLLGTAVMPVVTLNGQRRPA